MQDTKYMKNNTSIIEHVKERPTPVAAASGSGWTFLSNHTHVLVCLAGGDADIVRTGGGGRDRPRTGGAAEPLPDRPAVQAPPSAGGRLRNRRTPGSGEVAHVRARGLIRTQADSSQAWRAISASTMTRNTARTKAWPLRIARWL